MTSSTLLGPMAALRHPDAAIDEPRHFHLGRIDDPPAEGFDRAKPHRHDFFQVFWIRSGQGTVQSDLKRFPILPHTMFFVSPGQVHAWDLGADATGEFLSLSAEFLHVGVDQPDFLAKLPFFYPSGVDPILYLDDDESAQIDDVFKQMRAFCRIDAPGRIDLVRAYLTIILGLARRFYDRRARPTTPVAPDRLVPRFRLALEQHFPRLLEVGEFARLLQVSRSHLNHELRRLTGQSASEIIHDRIMLEARRLLVHSSMTVSEIAYHLRFQDPSYFGRFFRRHLGQTPGQYREDTQRLLLAS